jgi:hypothetical protein
MFNTLLERLQEIRDVIERPDRQCGWNASSGQQHTTSMNAQVASTEELPVDASAKNATAEHNGTLNAEVALKNELPAVTAGINASAEQSSSSSVTTHPPSESTSVEIVSFL